MKSAAAAQARLAAAGYRTSGARQHEERCSTCDHVRPPPDGRRNSNHDRYCSRNDAIVKTYRWCTHWIRTNERS